MSDAGGRAFESRDRRALFLEMAGRPEGTSPAEVHTRASGQGDTATSEAYYNMARRLVHRGVLIPFESEKGTRYRIGANKDNHWLEEDDLGALVDPEYPLLALTVWKEARRQISQIPESLWIELRDRLRGRSARELFHKAIISYADDFHALVSDLVEADKNPTPELPKLRQEAENSRRLLQGLTKFGLGLSLQAVNLPLAIDVAIAEMKAGRRDPYVNPEILQEELARRVADEPFVVDVPEVPPTGTMLIGAVDGSTRGGILSFLGESGDLAVGHAPMIAINTSVGQVNQSLKDGGRAVPIFTRLPEKPEDMQRQDNRYTVMAKLFFQDLTDAEYMHSVWNAMDLVEAKAALRLLDRWYGPKPQVEIAPADVVLRDGTVSPQDRDFNHYAAISTYGQIVRDMISVNWKITQKCRDDRQTLAGVVKAAQLSVLGPVLNWFASQVARDGGGQLESWPMQSMNLVPDQILITRLLTAGREKKDPWSRTCLVMRPFHATTNFAKTYSRRRPPSKIILEDYEASKLDTGEDNQEKKIFFQTFRPDSDPYLKMLDNAFYGSFFLGSVPRLDLEKHLPRLELLVPGPTAEDKEAAWDEAHRHVSRLVAALRQNGFEVSAEHSMFQSDAKLDVLPALIIRVHDTVKIWASELLSRVQEYVGYLLSRYVATKRLKGVKVRPFTKNELNLLYDQLRTERERTAGEAPKPQLGQEPGAEK